MTISNLSSQTTHCLSKTNKREKLERQDGMGLEPASALSNLLAMLGNKIPEQASRTNFRPSIHPRSLLVHEGPQLRTHLLVPLARRRTLHDTLLLAYPRIWDVLADMMATPNHRSPLQSFSSLTHTIQTLALRN